MNFMTSLATGHSSGSRQGNYVSPLLSSLNLTVLRGLPVCLVLKVNFASFTQ